MRSLVGLLAFCVVLQAGAAKDLKSLQKQTDEAIRAGKIREALEFLSDGLKENPEWTDGLWRLGTLLYDAESWVPAQEAFEKLVKLDPKSGAPSVLLGLCEFQLRNYGKAVQHIERGITLGLPPELELDQTAAYNEALALILTGHYEQASTVIGGWTRKGSKDPEWTIAAGLAALHIPALPTALGEILGKDRYQLIETVGKAEQCLARREIKEGMASYGTIVKEFPNFVALRLSYALQLLRNVQFSESRAEFAKAAELDPHSVGAQLGLALIAMEEQSPTAALPYARKAVQLDPKGFTGHYVLGLLLTKSGEMQEARKELELSRDLEPNLSRIRFALVQVYLRLKMAPEAATERRAFSQLQEMENSFRDSGKFPVSLFEGKQL